MDRHALDVLELDAIRARLADETAFDGGRALAEALAPSAEVAEVAARQARTAEAILLALADPPRLAGAHDVRASAALAARGGALRPAALAEVAETCRTGVDARRVLDGSEGAPLLAGIVGRIAPTLGTLADRVEAAVESDGSGLRDDASPALRRIRRELGSARARSAERLRSLATELRPHLQEEFVTERGGRPVLAVRAAARRSVPGIVHDTSGSGQTLFVEPLALVEAQNAIRELESSERDEVERILAALSKLVGVAAPDLVAAVEALAELDLALACATLSQRLGGCPVELADEVLLVEARHPLLDPATAVPIDLDLRGVRTLVVSGPNTGGKTVGLKTLGLAALLHQCGLRPPAKRAALPVYADVLADIGDEQSIAMSLSTFSGHVRNLVAILSAAGPRTLVLLDEIAAGTDPVEGAALARALLQAFMARGATVLVTTHYAELKEWASATDGALNAAVGIDPRTLEPTYRIALGRPGASHALAIAERLGLDAAVVGAAREQIAPERLRIERLLAEAAGAERDATAARGAAEDARAAAEGALRDAERRERELREALEAVREGARAERERVREEARASLAAYERELEGLRVEIRSARREERRRAGAASEAAAHAERDRDRSLERASRRTREAARTLQGALVEPELPPARPLAVGDPVVARALGLRGTIAEIDGEIAEVHEGPMRMRVPLVQLAPDPRARAGARPEPPVQVRLTTPTGVASSLDLRGQRADEARDAVRAYVDAAHLAGRGEVEVIHGRGTGAVRKAVRDELAAHPLVESTAPASHDGATLVKLALRSRNG